MQPSKRDVILPLTLLMSVSSLSVSFSLSHNPSLFPLSPVWQTTQPVLLVQERHVHCLPYYSILTGSLTRSVDCHSARLRKNKRGGADTDGSIILKLAENKVELKSGLRTGPK